MPGADGSRLVPRHRAVISHRLAGLGAEVFDRLEVQQAVDRLLVRIGVLIVHLAAQLHPPFGDAEREGDVERDGNEHDSHVLPAEHRGEDDRDHRQFKDQRPDREQHEAQQEIDALHPALDDPAQASGLARDMVAHRQAVDMRERLEREATQRALAHPDEDRIAQLIERDGPKTRHPIGHGQADRTVDKQPGIVAVLARQRIHGGLVEEGGRNRDDLAHHQRHQGQDHAALHPGLALWPEIGKHAAHRLQAARGFSGHVGARRRSCHASQSRILRRRPETHRCSGSGLGLYIVQQLLSN